jgi:mono/diheme cytochrome c family protein
MRLRILAVTAAATTLFAVLPIHAQDGPTLYKTKCAACHGADAQGKPNMGPKIAGSAKTEAVLTKGGEPKAPHIKPLSTVTPDQVTALAAYLKTLK